MPTKRSILHEREGHQFTDQLLDSSRTGKGTSSLINCSILHEREGHEFTRAAKSPEILLRFSA